jgi:peptidoglycan/LPS O-acetylase OafA/YrhL
VTDALPGVTVFGRPFKPVSLGVTVLMVGLVIIPVFDLGGFGRGMSSGIASVIALVAAGMLGWGWWRNNLRWTERGLAVACFAYASRLIYLIFVRPAGDSVMLALGVLVIIAGSYVLEANDRRAREWSQ